MAAMSLPWLRRCNCHGDGDGGGRTHGARTVCRVCVPLERVYSLLVELPVGLVWEISSEALDPSALLLPLPRGARIARAAKDAEEATPRERREATAGAGAGAGARAAVRAVELRRPCDAHPLSQTPRMRAPGEPFLDQVFGEVV